MDDFYEPDLSSIEEESENESDTDSLNCSVQSSDDFGMLETKSPSKQPIDLDNLNNSDTVDFEPLDEDEVFLSENNKIEREENKENQNTTEENESVYKPRVRKISSEILKRVILSYFCFALV